VDGFGLKAPVVSPIRLAAGRLGARSRIRSPLGGQDAQDGVDQGGFLPTPGPPVITSTLLEEGLLPRCLLAAASFGPALCFSTQGVQWRPRMLPRAEALQVQGWRAFGDRRLIAVADAPARWRGSPARLSAPPSLGDSRSRALWINPGSIGSRRGGAALLNRPLGARR